MNPATLSIITATFPPRERGQAIGIWAGVSAMALAIGPLVGGLIVDNINWNWIFFVNVPVGVAGIVVSMLVITESRDTSHEQSIDLPGPRHLGRRAVRAHLRADRGQQHGWRSRGDPRAVRGGGRPARRRSSCSSTASACRCSTSSLFKIGSFTGANIVAMLVSLGMFGVFFFVSLYIQNILGYSPTQAGAAFLPMTILIIIVAPIAGKMSDRIGSRWLMGAGMTLVGDLAAPLPAGRRSIRPSGRSCRRCCSAASAWR